MWILRFPGGVRFILIVRVFSASSLSQHFDDDLSKRYTESVPPPPFVPNDNRIRGMQHPIVRCASTQSICSCEEQPAILVGGMKGEMVLRPKGLLRTRKLDLLVRRMIGIED